MRVAALAFIAWPVAKLVFVGFSVFGSRAFVEVHCLSPVAWAKCVTHSNVVLSRFCAGINGECWCFPHVVWCLPEDWLPEGSGL